MTIGNALAFIERGQKDIDLRDRLNVATSCRERDAVLAVEKLTFSAHDFDEAFHHRLTLCQQAEEAEQLKEFRMWWDMLSQILEPAGCGNGCSGCCQ
jgi:hypothetical protein